MNITEFARTLIRPPFERKRLSNYVEQLIRSTGIDHTQTVEWALAHSPNLRAALKSVWSRSQLPLSDWEQYIGEVGILWLENSKEFGLAVLIQAAQPFFVVQQAPIEADVCRQKLSQHLRAPDPHLIELFSAAPGLRIDMGPVIALPSFLWNPMDTIARARYGPSAGLEYCFHSDIAVYSPNTCALELAWDRDKPLQYDFVVLSRDGRVFLDRMDTTDVLTECSITVTEFIAAFFRNSRSVFEYTATLLRPQGETIGYYRAGDTARVEFSRLSVFDKAAVVLRLIASCLRGADDSPGWLQFADLVDSCVSALVSHSSIEDNTLRQSDEIAEDPVWLEERDSNWMVEPAMLVSALPKVIRAWNRKTPDLAYPEMINARSLRSRATYDVLLEEIGRLGEIRTNARQRREDDYRRLFAVS